ncbi:MAG: AI-2E family transporter [Ruminococcaceae bacterium]|nr:AI-2E family transporter [Oscillospiraceae bacterium]
MKVKELSKYFSIFLLGVLLIAVYKMFDSIDIIFAFIGKVFSILVPFVIAFFISVFVYPICIFFEKLIDKSTIEFIRKRRRGLSVLIVYTIFLAILFLIIWFLIPSLIKSIYNFVSNIYLYIANIEAFLNSYEWINIDFDYILSTINYNEILSKIDFNTLSKQATTSVVSFSSIFIDFFIAIIASIYMLLDRKELKQLLSKIGKKVFKEKAYNNLLKYGSKLHEYLYKYLYCLIIDGLVMFVLSFILMSVLRIRYSLVLAIILGLFNIIPYFGAIIAGVLVCVTTIFTTDLQTAIILAVAIVILQQIDSNIIQPKLVKDSLEIKPLWVIFGVILGGGLFGFAGLLLAVPIMGLIRYIFKESIDGESDETEISTSN